MTTYSSSPFQPGVTSDVFTPDQLIAGRFPLVTDTVTLASGQGVVKRGTVLGKITASGKYAVATAAAVDGSQNPAAVSADTVDTSGGDKLAGVYLAGEFNTRSMTFGTGYTADAVKDTLRDAGIYLKTVSAALSADDPL